MRVIIIEDKDARALVDALSLEFFQSNKYYSNSPDERAIAEKVHARFHHVVVRWLQEQGASVTR